MRKLSFKINQTYKKKISYFLDNFENISVFPEGNFLNIDLYISLDEIKSSELIDLKNEIGPFKSVLIKDKDWIQNNIKNDRGVTSNLFHISQGLSRSRNEKKYNLLIPAGNAFGTGTHESTYLAIISLEYLVKKKKIFSALDLGSGTGILAFILRKLIYGKIMAIDVDNNCKKSFFDNLKKNNLNDIFFQLSDGFKNKFFKRKKFDLIVSNMLLNCQSHLVRPFFLKLRKNGILLLTGILRIQENEIIIKLSKYRLILIKKIYKHNWVSLIFIKKVF